VELQKCGQCRTVSYCRKECQREHWLQAHKRECKGLAAAAQLKADPREGGGDSTRDPAPPTGAARAQILAALELGQYGALTNGTQIFWALQALRQKYSAAGPRQARYWWIFDDALAVIAHSLATQGHVILDGFLDAPSTATLRADVQRAAAGGALAERGGLTDARDGRNTSYVKDTTRGDHVGWFQGSEHWWTLREGADPASTAPDAPPDSLAGYMVKIGTLVDELKAHLPGDLGGVHSRSRAMVTLYPPGARYSPHVDNGGACSNGRRLTALLYLNTGWVEGDGGELAIFHPTPTPRGPAKGEEEEEEQQQQQVGAQRRVRRVVEPRGGRWPAVFQ